MSCQEVTKIDNVNYQLKEIIEVIDDESLINKELDQLVTFLSTSYLVSKMQALQSILPKNLKPHSNHSKVVKEVYLEYKANDVKLSPKQDEAYNYLKELKEIKQSTFNKVYSNAITKALFDKDCLKKVEKDKTYQLVDESLAPFLKLNDDQEKVYQTVINSSKQKFLLHGVTGSGKTEVFLHLSDYYLKQGKTVLILVPEITLSIMMQKKFASRFKNKIAIINSKLTNQEKYQEYLKVKNKQVNIVVGTRSSVFAPLENIGLIIMDEEHDNSYKQSTGLMYHTHDVALFRSEYHKAKILFASATPSIASLTKAYTKKYQYLTLNKRFAKQAMPQVSLVDLNYEPLDKIVSQKVINKMHQYLDADKQVIVLLNRRGYHQMFQCRDCFEVRMCPHCNVALTYHHTTKTLNCHHCGYQTKDISHCLSCGSTDLKRLGYGTQRIEEYLINTFSKYQVLRLDQDSVRKKNSMDKKLMAFKNKEYQILIGTQMIAKGLDFEDVDLIVVLNIDSSLAFNSYDALESAFSLLVQVAGRAGRHSGQGQVLIETFQPEHEVIQYAKANNYLGFYENEMRNRKKYDNPPYYYIALVLISSYDEISLNKESLNIYHYLKDHINNAIISNNAYHPIYKLANAYRQQISIKYKDFNDIKEALINIKQVYAAKKNINVIIDVNY